MILTRAHGFNPGKDIQGLASWWSPSDAPVILGNTDDAGSYQLLVDLGPARNNLVPQNGANFGWTPTRAPNGRPAAVVDASGGGSSFTGMYASKTPAAAYPGIVGATVIVAFSKITNNDARWIYSGFGNAVDFTYQAYTDGMTYDDFFSSVRKSYTNAISYVGSHIVATRSKNNQWDSWTDGLLQFSTTSNTFAPGVTAVPGVACLSILNGTSTLFEMILVGRYVSDAELLRITTYLSNRWRIPIT